MREMEINCLPLRFWSAFVFLLSVVLAFLPGGISSSSAFEKAVEVKAHTISRADTAKGDSVGQARKPGVRVEKVLSSAFNGGAIAGICAGGKEDLFVVAGMPEGFSIYKFTPASDVYEKFISSAYLSSFLPASTDPSSLAISSDESGRLLAIYSQGGNKLVVLNCLNAPRIKRFTVRLPEHFLPGGACFLDERRVFVFSRGFSPRLANYPILELDLGDGDSARALPIRLNRDFVVLRYFRLINDSEAVVLGYFEPFSTISSTGVGVINLASRVLDIWDYSGAVLICARGNAVCLVKSLDEEGSVTLGQVSGGVPSKELPAYELIILTKDGNRYPGTLSVPIYGKPVWASLGQVPFIAYLLVENEVGERDLWLIDTSTRQKSLVEENVLGAEVFSDGKRVAVLPSAENAIHIYEVSL